MSGVVRVNTIELESLASRWAALAHTFDEWCASWQQWSFASAVPLPVEHAASCNDIAQRAREIQLALTDIATRLERVAQTYADVDAATTVLLQRASDVCLWLIGRMLPVLVCLFGPLALSELLSVAVSRMLVAALPESVRNPVERFSTETWARALSSPGVVRAIELGIGSLDEGVLGAAGVSLPVTLLVGGAGMGLTSLAGTSRFASRINAMVTDPASALAASAGSGTATRASVERISSQSVNPPRDLADALARIPDPSVAGAQVRIEKYGDTHVVYIAGTVDASLGAGAEPWDMSSNLAALGGDSGASEDAVRRAMVEAGIRSGDPVVIVGHSQGGILALRVAQSTDVSVTAVLTAGAPVHAMRPPDGVPVVAYEHIDDIVPALGGVVTDAQPDLVYVRDRGVRNDSGPLDTLLPAHRLEAYVETAQRSDGNGDPTVQRVRDEFARLSPTGTSTLWRATRSEAEK